MPWWRRTQDQDLDREVRAHLDLLADEQRGRLSDAEARHAARREFGNPTLWKEVTREMWSWTAFERLLQDLRYAGRMMRRGPALTAIAVLSLALGIGANTAIFRFMDAVLLRPLPVAHPDELERIPGYFSYPMFRELAERNQVFSGLLARFIVPVSVSGTGRAERAIAELVSGNYFELLGVQATLGRTLSSTDNKVPMGHPVAVISHRYWRLKRSADPEILGKKITIDNYPFTIIGVAPPGFFGVEVGSAPDVWVPVMMQPQLFELGRPVFDNTGFG